ncbi:MAG TPA: class I SAM-dependent methyltransferase [Armatimonadota bacterium]|jgi:SAM-dependent methyltransferase
MDETWRHEQTRRAWDITAAKYEAEAEEGLRLLREGGTSLLSPEQRVLAPLLADCGRAIHLQCAGGTDTLSLWKGGAREVVGLDISEPMLRCARRKAEALGAPALWVRSDVLDAPPDLDGTADLVYTGRGALPWVMDLEAWAATVHRLLKPGGHLFVYEGHPLDWVWDFDAATYTPSPESGGYFAQSPRVDRGWPMPFVAHRDPRPPDDVHAHEHQWTLGQVVTASAAAGLRVMRLEEHPEPYWDQFTNLPAALQELLPHTFLLLCRKGGS